MASQGFDLNVSRYLLEYWIYSLTLLDSFYDLKVRTIFRSIKIYEDFIAGASRGKYSNLESAEAE